MATWAAGLARGVAGYMDGRRQADERDYERERIRRAEDRQNRLDAQQAEMMRAQLEAMRQSAEMARQNAQRQQDTDNRNLYESGYRSQEDTQRMSDALAPLSAAQSLPGMQGVGGLASYGKAAQQGAQSPAFSFGGRPMVKAGESFAERSARLRDELDASRRRDDREYESRTWSERDAQNFEQQKALARLQAQLRPREPRAPNLVQGNDGNMYEYRNGQMVPVPVAGGQPPMGGDQPQGVPVPSGMGRASGAGPGGGGMGPFGKQAPVDKDFKEAEIASRQLVSMLGQYRDMLDKHGTALFTGNSPSRNAMQALQRQIAVLYKGPAFANLGVLSGPDLEILNDIISPSAGVKAVTKGKQGIQAQIDQVLMNAEEMRRTRHDMAGIPYRPLGAAASPAGGDRPPLSSFMR